MKELLITGTWASKDKFSQQKDRKIIIKEKKQGCAPKAPGCCR